MLASETSYEYCSNLSAEPNPALLTAAWSRTGAGRSKLGVVETIHNAETAVEPRAGRMLIRNGF
jgi:hypothetical protein